MTDPTAQPPGGESGGYGSYNAGGPNMPPPPPMGAGGPEGPDKSGNVFGIIALIAGIVSIVVCCIYAGFWGGIPAIILGVIGRKKADNGQATNRSMATVGLILGIVGLVLTIALIIVGIVASNSDWYKNLPTS